MLLLGSYKKTLKKINQGARFFFLFKKKIMAHWILYFKQEVSAILFVFWNLRYAERKVGAARLNRKKRKKKRLHRTLLNT